MTAKAIVDVEINDSKFREFHALFNEYQKKLEDMPEDWKKVVDVIDDAGGGMHDFSQSSKHSKDFLMIAAIQADAISKAINSAAGVQDKFNKKTKDGAIQMGRMAKFSKEMHKDISRMSGVLLKLGAVGGAALSFPAAVFASVNALAGQNLQARGLGLRIGQTQAFGANFEKFGLGASDLGNVANAQGDVSKWRAFIAAGLTQQQIQNEDAEQLTYDFARAASSQYREWQKAGLPAASMAQAYGFTDLLSLQQLRTGASYNDSEWMKAQQKEIEDAKKAEVDQKTADQASDVKASLKSDWAQVINAFNEQLAAVAPELKIMGDAAAVAAINLLKVAGPEAKKLLDALEGPPISREEAGKKEGIVGGLARMGYAIRDLMTFGSITKGPDEPNFHWDWKHPFGQIVRDGGNKFGSTSFSEIESSRGLPPGFLYAQMMAESRGNVNAVSPKGAKGPFQLMDATAKEYGISDPFNLGVSANVAGIINSKNLKRYGGDIRKALAAYNWGMGNLDKDIAKNGSNWEANAPAETRDYIERVARIMARQGQNVNINITNSTGANVATSMNAAPH